MTIYCLSGLGVDSRAFERISIPGMRLIHVDWTPANRRESVENYAKRLFEIINPSEEYALMGVSFGGMIAQEWAKIRAPKYLILVSTTSTYKNVSPLLRIPGKMGLYRVLHPKIAAYLSFATNWFFGAKTKEDKQMLKEIMIDTDPNFLRWATGALLQWRCRPELNAIRIHGKMDRIIGAPECSNFFTNGGHFAIFSNGAEISVYLSEIIAKKDN